MSTINTATTWEERQEIHFANERKEAEAKATTISDLCVKITPALTAEGFMVSLAVKEENDSHKRNEIEITCLDLPYFKATINNIWAGEKAALYFTEGRRVTTELKNARYNGESDFRHVTYTFCSVLATSRLEELGIPSINYTRDVRSLRKEFKPTKNVKLILNDILPALKIYRAVVIEASPLIDQKITKEHATLKLMQDVQLREDKEDHNGKGWVPQELRDMHYHFQGIGHVTINTYGSITITITREVTEDELRNLLSI